MTKQKQYTDEELKQLYTQRKAQHTAPLSIKRQLLAKQQDNQSTTFIFRRMSYVAVAASTLLLMSLLLLQQTEPIRVDDGYQIVQIHTLKQPASGQSVDIKHRYANHYQDYLAQKELYAAHHKTKARLNFVDDGWQLTSCNNETKATLQISNDLIAALSNIQQVDTHINTGDIVEIAFDQTGIILGITRSGNHLQC
jgi:hypothetical protein